jgi:exonuclease SbcC
MIPKNLTLTGFLSYRQPVEVNFEQLRLACISGPNGAGKSSLLDAITWVLFGQARKRDDSVINTQSETAEVSLIFEYETNNYRVQRTKTRGKTTVLEFQIETPELGWKPLTERTLRDTEARIQEVLRLDYETFVNASFFLQGKADQFTQQRPADRKRILSSILGLEVWETYRKETVDRRKVLEAESAKLKGRLEEIANELAEEEIRKQSLNELQTRLESLTKARMAQEELLAEKRRQAASIQEQEKMVNTLAAQLERSKHRLSILETTLTNRRKELEQLDVILERAVEIDANHKAWQEARDDLEQWNTIAQRFREHEARRQIPLTEIEKERARLETEKDNLLKEQTLLEEVVAELPEMRLQKEKTQSEVMAAEEEVLKRKELESQLSTAIQKQAKAQAENPRLKSEMDVLKDRIDRLSETEGAVCPLCGQPLEPTERQRLIENLSDEGKEMGDRYRENQAHLQEIDYLVRDLQNKINKYVQVDSNLRGLTRQLDRVASTIEQVEMQRENWLEKGARRLDEIEEKIEEETFAVEARRTLQKIDTELKEIGYDAGAHDIVRKTESRLSIAEQEMRALEGARASMKQLERNIGELREQINTQENEIGKQKEEHDQAYAALENALQSAPDVESAQRAMLALQEEENRSRQEMGAAQQKVDVLQDLKARRVELEDEQVFLGYRITRLSVLERSFGKNGVPAMLIEQALPQIESKANEVLERLSGGNMSIRFITQQAYKDTSRDDLRETLDIQISDNAGIRDYEMFSGGEAFRINFAIRLALSEVLAQRAGAKLQTLVVDEGFGSQDEMGRQRLIEAINLVKGDFAIILVITHIDALKDAFPDRIEVEKTALGSAISVV